MRGREKARTVGLIIMGRIVIREREAPLLPRRHQNLNQTREQTFIRLHVNVKFGSDKEHECRQQHEPCRNSETNHPSKLVLYVYYDRHCYHKRNPQGGIVPVEKALHNPRVIIWAFSGFVELVCPECNRARPDSSGSDRHEDESCEEENVLDWFWVVACSMISNVLYIAFG